MRDLFTILYKVAREKHGGGFDLGIHLVVLVLAQICGRVNSVGFDHGFLVLEHGA